MKFNPKNWYIVIFFVFTITLIVRVEHNLSKPNDPLNKQPQLNPNAPQAKMFKTSFNSLPEWRKVNHVTSLKVFQKSCQIMLKKNPTEKMTFGDKTINYQDWFRVCNAALKLSKNISQYEAKTFFENHFIPKIWKEKTSTLFTGYYSPYIEGRLTKSPEFNYPIYATPDNLVFLNLKDFSTHFPKKTLYGKIVNQHFVAYDTRKQIYNGSIKNRAQVIAWVKTPMDGLELEIQGAGIIRTPEKELILNYAAQNGHSYHAIGKFLIQEGKLNRKSVTMTTIRKYFEQHPDEMKRIFIKNPSFVFFKLMNEIAFYGYQNINLSPGYSIAVDTNYIPMGAPVFISTTLPNQHPFHRLMIAQDVGGAIKGPTRGDIYWGTGLKAKQLASDMKQVGEMWYLFPIIRN